MEGSGGGWGGHGGPGGSRDWLVLRDNDRQHRVVDGVVGVARSLQLLPRRVPAAEGVAGQLQPLPWR